MLVLLIRRYVTRLQQKLSKFKIQRHFKDDPKQCLFGGGLEKCQGGFKEEAYFNQQELQLITKIREQGVLVKAGSSVDTRNLEKFEKALASSVSQTCSKVKHKNMQEEAYFWNEQKEKVKMLMEKMKKAPPMQALESVGRKSDRPDDIPEGSEFVKVSKIAQGDNAEEPLTPVETRELRETIGSVVESEKNEHQK